MKKFIIVFGIGILLIGGGIWVWDILNTTENNKQAKNNTSNISNTTNNSNYQAERSGTIANNQTDNSGNVSSEITIQKKETEMAAFSTKIYNKDEERQNNIGITCRTLSTKEVNPGETFSFCDTVGKATTAKGYQEADIYVEGKKEQGLGGGNCQVSTTLYNAVLQVPELEIIERHKHSGHVPYIQNGQDAAVAYGSYDFKFKNNTNNVVKIIMENTAENITAKLIKIE